MLDEHNPSGDQDPHNPGQDGPAPDNGPAGDDGGKPKKTPEEQLADANALISDLKAVAGVKSVKELKEKLNPKPPADKPTPPKNEHGEYVTRDEIALLNKGYTPEELDIAQRLAPGRKLSEAIEDPVAKAAIRGIRAERNASAAAPEPSSRIPVHQGKSFGELEQPQRAAAYGNTFQALVEKGRQARPRSPGR